MMYHKENAIIIFKKNYTIKFVICFTIWEVFSLLFSPDGGPFSPCGGHFATFFLNVGAFLVLMGGGGLLMKYAIDN